MVYASESHCWTKMRGSCESLLDLSAFNLNSLSCSLLISFTNLAIFHCLLMLLCWLEVAGTSQVRKSYLCWGTFTDHDLIALDWALATSNNGNGAQLKPIMMTQLREGNAKVCVLF